MSDQPVNVPISVFEQMAAAPLRLAALEAAQLARAGDVAGADRRIAEGVAQSAAIRAQSAAQQQASPTAPAAAPAQPGSPAPTAATTPTIPAPSGPLAAPGTPSPVTDPMTARWRQIPQSVRSFIPPQTLAAITRQAGEAGPRIAEDLERG